MPLAEFPLEGAPGARLIVEVDAPASPDGIVRVATGEGGLIKAAQSFDDSLGTLKVVATRVFDTLKELAPTEAEVEMGFKLTASAGVVLAKAGGEAHFRVKLVWK